MSAREFADEDVHHYVELRGVYDGWSIAVLKDGSIVNRWPADDRRHAATEKYIAEHNWLEEPT